MNSTVWESEDVDLLNDHTQNEIREDHCANEDEPLAGNRVDALRHLTLQLFREVQSISDVEPLKMELGFDYYDEVRRFEIDLIKRALIQTAGHQRRAARLLNLKVTTLNSKIKLFNIDVDEAVHYSLVIEPETGPRNAAV